MAKKNKTPLGIFTESIGLYFSNFDKFVKYMTFPVLGQIGGLLLTFICAYFYSKSLPTLVEKYAFFNNFGTLVLCSILVAIPGMIIFVKAFWEYLVSYGAINSMLENMLKSGKVYDFDAHTELIKRRTIPFVGLWFLFGLFSLISFCPLFWIPCGILAVFFVLVFQVFTYEPDLSPIGCARRSMILVHGHFASTFMLLALAGALTYILIPHLVNMLSEFLNLTNFLALGVGTFVKELPLDELNHTLSLIYMPPLEVEDIATFTVTTFIAQIFIQYTLPLRSILWGMWYRELNGGKCGVALPKTGEAKKHRTVKKPSEKLMEESHKKWGKSGGKLEGKSEGKISVKKIDRNILRRAMEKDEE